MTYGDGTYRRRIRLDGRPGEAVGELEDDFHHFRAHIAHDGERVTSARGEAVRYPWTTCPGAVAPLAALVGMPLSRESADAQAHTNPSAQCTHLFDAAGLAVSHAASGRQARAYDVAVPDRKKGRTRVELAVDGAAHLAWDLDGNTIVAPEPWAGLHVIGRDLVVYCREALDPDEREAALVLRRACHISIGRRYDFDAMRDPSQFTAMTLGSCHTFTPGIVEGSLRVVGSARDLSAGPSQPPPGSAPRGA